MATQKCEKKYEPTLSEQVTRLVLKAASSADYSVEHIASELCLSVRTFNRHLKKETGLAPKVFILTLQMQKAKHLLLQDRQIHVSAIAVVCGFEDASSFSHTFKRMCGVNPTKYREE